MKYMRADVTLLLAAMVGGLVTLGSSDGIRAAADLGRGRHTMNWCTEHLGAADDAQETQATESSEKAAVAEDSHSDNEATSESMASDAYSPEADYEHNYPYYGREGDYEAYGHEMAGGRDGDYASTSGNDASMDDDSVDSEGTSMNDEAAYRPDDYTEGRIGDEMPNEPSSLDDADSDVPSPKEAMYDEMSAEPSYSNDADSDAQPSKEAMGVDEADHFHDEYAEYGRAGNESGFEYQPEPVNAGDVSSYQESTLEEKYGYAEEMSGRTSDQESADAAERADETSNADMDYADHTPSVAEPYTGYESRVEANEQGLANESAWDVGPNEANLDQSDWMPSENNEPVQNEAKPAEGLERFGYLPSHLLIRPDVELLGDLRRMAEQSPGERQVAFREYVESLGSEAIEFTTQYENATGDEAAMLTDDVASSAAFLAVYRLYEQGEIGIDEAIDLLRQTLNSLSQEWIDGVNEITSESDFGSRQTVSLEGMSDQASVSAPRALWQAVTSWASQRAGQWKTALIGVWARQLSSLDWQSVLSIASSNVDTYHFD
jgi:hypothetical protein